MEQNHTGCSIVFFDGYSAGREGDLRAANPYMAHSISEAHWFAGWDEGSAKRARVNADHLVVRPTA